MELQWETIGNDSAGCVVLDGGLSKVKQTSPIKRNFD
jgi:hypothetical protein